jgi:hypothetical protein
MSARPSNKRRVLCFVSSYKSLPVVRFQAVLDWLAGWYANLQGGLTGGPPHMHP